MSYHAVPQGVSAILKNIVRGVIVRIWDCASHFRTLLPGQLDPTDGINCRAQIQPNAETGVSRGLIK